ncbi:MAG: hypothetical protein ACRDZ4_08495 [Egibacteraceae bacterium]
MTEDPDRLEADIDEARRLLAARLRELRRAADLSGEQLAALPLVSVEGVEDRDRQDGTPGRRRQRWMQARIARVEAARRSFGPSSR